MEKGFEQDHCGKIHLTALDGGPNQVNHILCLRKSALGFKIGRLVSKQGWSWNT